MAAISRPEKRLPVLAWYTPFEPYAFGLLRIVVGVVIAIHGYSRLFLGRSAPEAGAYLTGVSPQLLGGFELVAGVLLALGLLVRPVALLVAVEWIAIAASVAVPKGGNWLMLGASLHYPVMIAAFAFAFVVSGGGRLALDQAVGLLRIASDEGSPLAHLIIRIAMGLMFLPSGIDKVFFGGGNRIAAGNITLLGLQPPLAWAWFVAVVEFGGAVLLILGLFVRPTAFAMFIELVVITTGISSLRGYYWTGNGMEISGVMACAMFALVIVGAGCYSLDHALGREF